MTNKVKFSELNLGDGFDLDIDADGHEPYFYKVSDTEGYQTHGTHGQGLRHTFKPDDLVSPNKFGAEVNIDPTDIERVAIGILAHSHVVISKAMSYWIEALGKNPDEMRHLDDYLLETVIPNGHLPLAEAFGQEGYTMPTEPYDRDNSAWCAIFDAEPFRDGNAEVYRRLGKLEAQDSLNDEKALLLLADAVRDYRVRGRVNSSSNTIMGTGSPLMIVESSLVAQIVEYHQRVLNNHSWYINQLEK